MSDPNEHPQASSFKRPREHEEADSDLQLSNLKEEPSKKLKTDSLALPLLSPS